MRGGCVSWWQRAFWPVMTLKVLMVILALMLDGAKAVPGRFFTSPTLINKWLPNAFNQISVITQQDCEKFCLKTSQCNAYAVSLFERKCRISNTKDAGSPVQNNGYSVFVKMKTEDEGYYIYETMYIKLGLTRMNAYDAAKSCAEEKGLLVAVRNEEIEEILYKIMIDHKVWYALIGVTDEGDEGNWKYSDGGPVSYDNWDWNGMWPRPDLNCAIVINTHEGVVWKHLSCYEKNYFFCQIPMF
ncbi:hypothetical protein SK128_008182 [Halocaridina rubra]|uniref:C-type lectin domain-containing protein n=1 Tax=Halocaridina rubra TaxID=373956 RepID=A0AAN8WDX2_HALRR